MIKQVILRIFHLLSSPEKEWIAIRREEDDKGKLFRNYILIPSVFLSLILFLLRCTAAGLWISLAAGAIHFCSFAGGAWIARLVTQEYLNGKTSGYASISSKLTIYCSSVFLVFRSLAASFPGTFLNDLLTVCSLFAVVVLFFGLKNLMELTDAQRTSALIIIALLIIVVPSLISHLLTLLFHLPAINA